MKQLAMGVEFAFFLRGVWVGTIMHPAGRASNSALRMQQEDLEKGCLRTVNSEWLCAGPLSEVGFLYKGFVSEFLRVFKYWRCRFQFFDGCYRVVYPCCTITIMGLYFRMLLSHPTFPL